MKLLALIVFFPLVLLVVLAKFSIGLMFLGLKAAIILVPFAIGYAVGRSSTTPRQIQA